MIDYNSEEYDFDESARSEKHFSLRSILVRDWPYIVMLVLAIFGVAYTNFARQAMTGYWMGLAPVFGLICVAARWRQMKAASPMCSSSCHRPFTGRRSSSRCISCSSRT